MDKFKLKKYTKMSYIKDTSKFYFQSTSGQRTIYSTKEENLEEILNEEGMKRYQNIMEKVENKEYKDKIKKWYTIRKR